MDDLDAGSWRARWEAYPFAAEFPEVPIGWVLQADSGEIVGSLGNVHMMYELGGRRLKASIATSWAVDAEYRSGSFPLITSFYRQKGVDLWLNGSANIATSQVLTALRIPRIPIPSYNEPCFWAIRPAAFAKAALARRKFRGAGLAAYPAGLALLVRDLVVRSGRREMFGQRPKGLRVEKLTGFDSRFDALWEDVAAGPVRLRAVRNRAVLAWRYGAEVSRGEALVLAAEAGGRLVGYAVLLRRSDAEQGMRLYDLADLQAAGDRADVMKELLVGSIALAKEAGADALKFTTGTPAKRRAAEALRPYTYHLPLWQLYYKAARPEVNEQLGSAEAWDFSLFDRF